MTGAPRPIEELDSLPAAEFIEAVAPLFEGARGFLGRLAGERPFSSWWNLLTRARAIALAMPEADQLELLNAHPRLGAPPETVSRMSFDEQGYDRATDEPTDGELSTGASASAPAPTPAPAAPLAPVAPPPPLAQSIGLRSRIQAASTPPEEPPRWGSAASAGAAPRPPTQSAQPPSPPVTAAVPVPSPDEGETTRARLARLNAAYEDWFGFRYCVFVAGRPVEALVPELEAAMTRTRDEELRRGIDAVVDIAIARSGAAR